MRIAPSAVVDFVLHYRQGAVPAVAAEELRALVRRASFRRALAVGELWAADEVPLVVRSSREGPVVTQVLRRERADAPRAA